MSLRARKVIKKADIIVGYKRYLDLIKKLIIDKESAAFGMREEIKRARYAIDQALGGKTVCIISSGDPCVYGMAAAVYEALDQEAGKIIVEVVPGIPAMCSCASLLGAPISHDCVMISLSDLLTDKDLIKRRIALAAQGDFVITLYNPKSKKRNELLNDACKILTRFKAPNTPVGIVKNAYRSKQVIKITTLGDMFNYDMIDMLTTIIIGNSKTFVKNGMMITPRGYL